MRNIQCNLCFCRKALQQNYYSSTFKFNHIVLLIYHFLIDRISRYKVQTTNWNLRTYRHKDLRKHYMTHVADETEKLSKMSNLQLEHTLHKLLSCELCQNCMFSAPEIQRSQFWPQNLCHGLTQMNISFPRPVKTIEDKYFFNDIIHREMQTYNIQREGEKTKRKAYHAYLLFKQQTRQGNILPSFRNEQGITSMKNNLLRKVTQACRPWIE